MIGIETGTESSKLLLGSMSSKSRTADDNGITFDKALETSISNSEENTELSELKKAINKQKCKYDLDGDGRVTKEEIEEALGKKKATREAEEMSEENEDSTDFSQKDTRDAEDTRKITNLNTDELDITKIAPMQSDKIMAIFKNLMEKGEKETA